MKALLLAAAIMLSGSFVLAHDCPKKPTPAPTLGPDHPWCQGDGKHPDCPR